MEPFIVANQVSDTHDDSFDRKYIYKTTEAMTQTWRQSWPCHLYLFYNIEQDCSISMLIVNVNEQYTIPANTYYLEDDLNSSNNYILPICFFYGNGTTVRTLHLELPGDGTSIYIRNLNVRAYYE